MNIQKDSVAYDEFVVLDESDNPVTGLIDSNFTKTLYDPDDNEVANISGGIPVTVAEMGDGLYKVSFTPNKLGNWALIINNATYFPYGKGNTYKCVETLIDGINEKINRLLGLSQENYRLFNPTYVTKNRQRCLTSATAKTYLTATDCENDTNPLAVYEITATYDSNGDMVTYKMKQVS